MQGKHSVGPGFGVYPRMLPGEQLWGFFRELWDEEAVPLAGEQKSLSI